MKNVNVFTDNHVILKRLHAINKMAGDHLMSIIEEYVKQPVSINIQNFILIQMRHHVFNNIRDFSLNEFDDIWEKI